MMTWNYISPRLNQFNTYQDYLRSDMWKNIKRQVFRKHGKQCHCCSRKATQVHHALYSESTMLGKTLMHLFPVCRTCHREMHRNRTLNQANEWLAQRCVKKAGKVSREGKTQARRRAKMNRDNRKHELAAAQWRM